MALNLEVGKVVALVGGVGGAKLAHGLAQTLSPENLTVIVNTGDDFWHYGLRICPDLDTVMYTLSGLVDKANGWGVADDTTNMLEALRRYGEDPWFRLGDKDIATHLLRTQLWHEGCTLTEITHHLTTALGIQPQVLPMTNEPIATIVNTVEFGELDFQTYFVRHRWQPTVRSLRLEGIDAARLSPQVQAVLDAADIILIAPSNPWLSIAPILAVKGVQEALLSRNIPRVALSPIVAGAALKGPAAKIMRELGYESSTLEVARYYGNIINGYVYDERDADVQIPVIRTVMFDTIMHTDGDRAALSQKTLDWIKGWN